MMTRKRLIEDVVEHPARFYRVPVDVLRDRRFDDSERARILDAWAESVDGDDLSLREKIEESRKEVARKNSQDDKFHSASGESQ
jgi:hypothetical protein